MNAELDGHRKENSFVTRMHSGASSRETVWYPKRSKNLAAVVVSK